MATNSDSNLNALLNQGIAACQAGDLESAKAALIAALKIDPHSELGWLWLSSALTDPVERRACLNRLLTINPNHAAAQSGLRWLNLHYPPEPAAPPAPPPSPEPKRPAVTPEPEWPAKEPAHLDETVAGWAAPARTPQTGPFSTTWDDTPQPPVEEPAADWRAAPPTSKTGPFSTPSDEPLEMNDEAATADWPPPARPGGTAPFSSTQPDEIETGAQPDWLEAALRRADEEAAPAEAEAPAGERPAWLNAALPAADEPATAAEAEERPAWLAAALQRTDDEPASVETEAAPAAEEEGVPGWLAEVNSREAAAEIEEAEEDEPPGWPPETSALAEHTPEPPAEATVPEVQLEAAAPVYAPKRTRPDATRCGWCGSPISSIDVNCPTCQRPLEFECPNCAYSVPLEEPQCPNCGHAMGDFYEERQIYLRELGKAYLDKEAYQKALPVYRNLIEIAPDVIPFQAGLLKIYTSLGQTQNAIPVAQHLLDLDPENAEALERLGRWYAVQGQFDELATVLDRLHAVQQRSPRLNLLLGDLEFERRAYPAAFRAYREAAVKPDFDKPTLARLHYRLGEMYLVAEDTLSALHAYQDCVAVGVDVHEVELSKARIEQIRPPLPPSATRSASETLRAMAGPLLLVWFTGFIQVGLNLGNLNAAAIVGLFAAVPGSYLIASAASTPSAIEWRKLLGEKGLTQPVYGAFIALLGALILVTAVVLILFGA